MLFTRRMLLPLFAAGAAGCNRIPGDQGAAAAPGARAEAAPNNTLVVVFQRFAADWINMLVPAGDSAYAPLRPTLAVSNPLPLDDYFGLNPGLNDLKTLYDAGDLAFVTSTGWLPTDHRDRSHFFAQQIAESGARAGVSDGWLARTMLQDGYQERVFAALAAESSVPVSLQGYAGAIALRDFAGYNHGSVMGDAATALQEMLAQTAGEPGASVLRLAQSIRAVAATPPEPSTVPYPGTTLGQGLQVAAQAIRYGFAPRVVTVTSDDDWDTHVTQAERHAQTLPAFAGAIKAFYDDLGPLMDGVTLVTMTEFGRKAVENLGGTDHGTGSSMLVLGKRVAGQKVYGQWPGLHASALYEGEDLEPTTDFRSVIGEILARHMGVTESALEGIFPGGYAASARWRGFMR